MLIREARPGDLESIIEIDNLVSKLAKPDYWRDTFANYVQHRDSRFFLVAEQDQVVKGFIIGEVRACAETWALFRGVVEEVAAVASARGIALTPGLVENILGQAARLEPQTASSLSNDLGAGRRLEIEALNGAVVRLGRESGVPTPLNVAIYGALKPYEGGRRAVP